MLTEWSTYDELHTALHEAQMYGFDSRRNQAVQRALRLGALYVFHRAKTPKSKVPALYWFEGGKNNIFFTFIVLQGSEGESFAIETTKDSKHGIVVIHSHAINRYRERRKLQGALEVVQKKVLSELVIFSPVNDSDTSYVSFDGGVFLCNRNDRILHLRTWISDRQCKPNQRLWSRKSEREIEELKEMLGIA